MIFYEIDNDDFELKDSVVKITKFKKKNKDNKKFKLIKQQFNYNKINFNKILEKISK